MQPLINGNKDDPMRIRRWLVGAAVLWSALIAVALFSPLGGMPWSLAHGSIWVLGLMGLVGAVRYFRHQDQEQARIEALLQDSEAKYRTVADFTYDWEYWIDQGRLLYVSPACERMTGYCPDEFIADPGLLQRIVHPEDRPAVAQHFNLYPQRVDEASANFDFRIITRRGETRWINHRCLPVFAEESYRGRRISNRDITRRKQTEADLQRTTCLLEAVRKAQALYLGEGDPRLVFKELLNILVTMTESEYGFVNEVRQDETGRLYEQSLALSDIAWDAGSRRLYNELEARSRVFRNLNNLLGVPAVTGQRVIANDAPHDPHSGGLPPGHPPLQTFMGMPIRFGGEIIGVAGIANRPGGYDDNLADWLEPFLATCASILHAVRSAQQRRQTEQSLRDSAESMTAILNALPESVFLMARDGTVLSANETMAQRLGHPVAAMLGTNAYALIPPDLAASRRERIETVFETAEPVQFEDMRESRIIDNSIYPVVDEQGVVSRVAVFGADITERRQVEEALWMANLYNRNLLEASLDSLMVIDPDGRFSDVNAATEQVTGYPRGKLLGTDFSAYFTDPERARSAYRRAFAQGAVRDDELAIRHREGRITPVLYNAAVCQDESGEIIGVFAAARDITERKRAEDALLKEQQRLEQMAHYDALTQLPNRVLLADRLRIALAVARREDRLLAICYLDLDGFKPVNDTLGHEAGDRLLAAVAGRLKQCLREGDTVARLGGDEFVLLLGGLNDVAEGERALQRLLAAIAEPYALGDGLLPVNISASVGVTLFPLDHPEPDILLRHADQAMYQAKHTGRNRYCRFSEG